MTTYHELPETLFNLPAPSIPQLSLRLARVDDGGQLHESCFPQRPFKRFREQFRRALNWQARGRAYWLIASWQEEPGGPVQIAGCGQLIRFAQKGEIAELAVTPSLQNQGVGTALITALSNIAGHLGLTEVEIGVAADNRRALALYQRLGFQMDRPVHLPGNQGEAIILRKKEEK